MSYSTFKPFNFLPKCKFVSSSELISPDGRHYAVFDQTKCEERGRSHTTVELGIVGNKERIVLLEAQGAVDVRMIWDGDRKVVVTVPDSAVVHKYGPYNDWPQVVERRLPNP